MILISLFLVSLGFFKTLSAYGVIYLLAYLPIMYLWGFLFGIPTVIGILKVSDTFAPRELWGTLFAQGFLIFLLLLLVNGLGITQILPFIVLVGIANGLAMPAASLRADRNDARTPNK